MKDAYSFDRDWEGLDSSYDQMYNCYEKIFDRCDLVYRAVEADTGAIGGSDSHEFCAISDHGESEIAYCDQCNMAATTERAACIDDEESSEEMLPVELVHTPNTKTIEEVASFLKLDKKKTIKALLFEVEGKEYKYVAAFLRGDREMNMVKLINALGIPEHAIAFADERAMGEATGAVGGFTGPVGLTNCKIIVDSELTKSRNLCAGACKLDHHMINVNYGRDYSADIVTDIKLIKEGYPCPNCRGTIKITRGIEVGQVFKLGTKYSQAMNAYYKDENMQNQIIVMGCYGIGVSRTLAAVVEQHHDKDGIIWPLSLAPYHVIITLINRDDETQVKLAEKIYGSLCKSGVEVLLDDRDERPGVKFKDADLIGMPIRITVGKKAGESIVEYKLRKEEKAIEKTAEDAIYSALELVKPYIK
jgi:prolyl-tRNA synthetase